MNTLGTLRKLNLRKVWLREDTDFTPWLAHEDNIKILGETVGMELEVEAQEQNVGPFRADILCKDTGSGKWVLIENQLERTDHIHLGQLITYAAGLDAVTIVWISSKFTEEHRAALDWLNKVTNEEIQFFGLEVELWQIGDSLPAPKFNIIAKPNDWTRAVSYSATRIAEGSTPVKAQQEQFWFGLHEYLKKTKSSLHGEKPRPKHWLLFALGKTGIQLSATINTRDSRLGAEVYIQTLSSKDDFSLLKAQKQEIERDFGEELDWQELEGKKACRIVIYKENTDPTQESDWGNQFAWFKDNLERLDKAFRQRVKNL